MIRLPILKMDQDQDQNLDEMLTQLNSDQEQPIVQDDPLEINDQVRQKMLNLMSRYLTLGHKKTQVNQIKKDLDHKIRTISTELSTLMKLYGVNELIVKDKKFVLDTTVRKKPLNKCEIRTKMCEYLNDPEAVEQIFQYIEGHTPEMISEKLKCVKYKEKQNKQTKPPDEST